MKLLFRVFSHELVPGSWEGHCRIKVHSDKPIKIIQLNETLLWFSALSFVLTLARHRRRLSSRWKCPQQCPSLFWLEAVISHNAEFKKLVVEIKNQPITPTADLDEDSRGLVENERQHQCPVHSLWCCQCVSFELTTFYSILKHTWIVRTSIYW